MNFADIVLRQEKDEINTTKTNGIDAFDPTWCDIMHHYRGFDSDFFAESCESAHREVSKDCLSLATERGICTETIFRFANLGDEGVLATLLRTNAYYHTVEEYKKALIENKNDFFILSLNKNGEPTGAIHYQFWWYHVGRQKIKTARQQGGPTDEHDVSTGPLVSEHIVTICSVEAVKNKTHKDNTRATGQLGVTLGQSEYRTGVVLTALALENARQNNVWYTVFQCDEPNGEKAQKFFKRFYRMSPVIRRARGKKAPAYLVVGDLGKSSFKYSIVCSKDDQVKLHGANRKNGSGNGMVRQRIIALLKMSPADVRSMPQPFKKGTDVSNTVVKITSDMSMYKDLSTENYDAPPKSGCNLDFQRIFSVSLPPSTPLSTELLDELKLKRNKLREREHTIASRAKLLIEKLVDERREYDAAEPERAHWTQILKEHKLMEKQRREASEAQKAQIEKDLDADCDVCGDGNVTCSNQILFCEACNIAVHQKCYGIDVIPAEDWFCKACVHYGRDKRIQRSQECGEPKPDLPPLEVSCLLCPKKDGAFVKAMDGKEFGFVHVVCAKWCGLNYVDKEKKDYVEDVSTTLAYHEKNTLSCDICDDKGGALFKCCHAGCKRYMHVTCARSSPTCTMKHGESSEGLIASENSWKVRCHLHANSESSFVSTDSAMVVANPSQADEKDNAKNATTVAVKADTANGTTFLTKDTKITVTPKIVEEAPKTTPKTDGRIKLKLKIKSPSKDKNKESNTVAKAPPTTSAPSAKDNSSSNFKVYPHPSSCAMTDTSVRKRTRKRKKLSEYSTDNDATVSNSKTAPFANDNFSSNLEVYPHPSSRAATDASVRKSTRKRKNIAESSSDNDAAVSNSKTVLTDFTTSAPDIMTVTEVSPKLPEIKKTDSQPSSCAATDISARKRTRKQKNILESSTENDATVSNNRIVLTGVTTSAPVIMTVTEVSLKLPEIRSQRRGKTRKSGKTSALDDNLGEEISVSDEEIYDVVKPSLKDKNAPVTGTETLSTPITITTTSSTKPKKNPKKEIYVSVEEIPDVVPPSIKDNNPSVTGIETLSTPRTRTTTSSTKPKKNLKRLFCDWKNRAQEEKNLERIISRSNWAEGAYCTLCDKQCDNINDLVSCRDCKYVAHRECIQLLGFNYTCKEARKETEKKVRGGLKVRDISCLKPIECNVCNYSSGLFVKAKATQVTKLKKKSGTDSFNFFGKELFIHANCAQLHQLLIDEDKCVECNKLICSDGRTHIRPKLSCSLCGEYSKPKISCNFKNGGKKCPQAFHASCAHNAGFDVFHSDPKEDCTSIYCFCHGRSQYSFRAKLEDLIEFERARLGEDYEKFGLNMGIKDQAVLYYASIRVLQQLAWAWKWVNWWIDDNQNWEPFLEEGQDESQMTSEELRIVESTVKSRKQDAEKCNLADFGAALRNRDYDLEEGDDEEAFDQALRAVLETPSLVSFLKSVCSLLFFLYTFALYLYKRLALCTSMKLTSLHSGWGVLTAQNHIFFILEMIKFLSLEKVLICIQMDLKDMNWMGVSFQEKLSMKHHL
uniref:PHD-type domain-containing protein n=2 Tax=Corethron hystrix TaxID=216773 RepID=A0A7S1BK89_9STRA